ncbi:hypothetical protein COJ79_05790 [Bacillus thuringiensis]|nr:hypothetical protein COJ79_05790 [Bacillus thuringiensis]QGV10503.1 hypothetical protein GNE09_28450 [Bacillus cereus]
MDFSFNSIKNRVVFMSITKINVVKEKEVKQSSFEVLNNFMVRSPLLSLDFFHKQLSNPQLNNLNLDDTLLFFKNIVENNKEIKEAIAVSSMSLLQSIQQITPDSKLKNKRNVVKGIFRYLNRISTRTTPFGLSASVGMGRFSTCNTSEDYASLKKYVQVDMEWATNLIKLLESDLSIVRQLKVKLNQGIMINGSRVKLNYSTDSVNDKQGEQNYVSTSINYNEVVEQVFEYSKEDIKFGDLLHKIYSTHSDVDIEIIERFIYELVKQEFLVTELRCSNEDTDTLKHILGILSEKNNIQVIGAELHDIYMNIKEYERATLGEGLSLYMDITEKMKQIVQVKNPLKVDLISLNNDYYIEETRRKDIEEIVELLCEFTAWNGNISNNDLKEYHSRFLGKYGLDREVPILELLDKELGLGAPNGYQYPPQNEGNIEQSFGLGHVDRIFLDKITECYLTNEMELSITDQDIEILKSQVVEKIALPDSLDVYFFRNVGNDKQYEFILGPNPYSTGAGTTLGRFINYLNDSDREFWREIAKKEQELHPNSILAEVLPTPINNRNLNVCQIGERRSHQINITNNLYTRNNINLNDIVIGATHDSLFIKSLSMGKEIIPLASHMLNPSLCPNIYRFLIEIGQQKTGNNYPYIFSNITNLGISFIPRITYKKFVLAPARWNIKTYSFKECKNEEEFYKHFKVFREKFNIPKLVFLVHFDNRILLDLENKIHLNDLFKETKKIKDNSFISLEESLYTESTDINHSQDCKEFVFSLVNRKKSIIKDGENIEFSKKLPIISDKERMEYPFENWIFVKLYCVNDRQEEMLGQHLYQFIKENNWYENFFFMRFKDPEFHIRIRFKADKEVLIHEGLPIIIKWINILKELGIINRVTFDTYDPEIERYGGAIAMEKAEKIFYLDSLISLELIRKKRFENFSVSKDILAFINVNHYMKFFKSDLTEQIEWLDKRIEYKEFLKEFRENRDEYLNYFKKFVVEDTSSLTVDESQLINLLIIRENALAEYVEYIRLLEQQGILYSNIDNILDSLIHLHLNRLIGINREYETKVLTLYRHALHNFNFQYTI